MGGWLQFAMRADALMGRTDMGICFSRARREGGWEKSNFGVFASPLDSSACSNFNLRCDVTSATLYLPRRKFSTLLGSLQSTEFRP